MQTAVPKTDSRVEPERAFEEWLIAALEHGRAQLAARRVASLPIAAAQLDRSAATFREGCEFR
jgi:hypothetical protein